MELPRDYVRSVKGVEEEELCDKCLFEKYESSVFSVEKLVEMWTITCEYDQCRRTANFITVPGNI